MIGHLKTESHARTFADYLYVQGIGNQIEAEKDGTWVVWVQGEDDVGQARDFLRSFLLQPDAPEYGRVAKRASELKEQEREQEEAAAKRYFDGNELFGKQGPFGMGPVTMALIGISVLVWTAMEFGRDKDFWNFLWISEHDANGIAERLRYGLQEIRHGQFWRIFTPIFIHAPLPMFLHILFNMLWLKDLGSMVEARQNSFMLVALVVCISGASNLAQYLVSGPKFGGMSGVVYGLLGYIWMKARFDPASGYFVHPTTVAIMLIWFVFCLAGGLSFANMRAANTVHAVGLGLGVVWGYLASLWGASRLR